MKKIKSFEPKKNMSVSALVKAYSNLGFQANSLSKAVDIIEEMVKDKQCTVFLGMAGALVPSGLKDIIVDMLNRKLISVFVTTGANLTHDLIEDLGGSHFILEKDEVDDIKLNKKNLNSIYEKNRPGDVMRHFADVSKAKKLFNFTPQINIEKGIELYIDWFKSRNYNLSELIKQDIVFNW